MNAFDQFDTQPTQNPFDQFDGHAATAPNTGQKLPYETTGEYWARGIGQGAQAGLEGLGSIFDLPRIPLNAMGANIPSVTDTIRAHSSFAPPTDIWSNLTRGATSAMGSMLPGAALAESAAPVVAGVGQTLTQNPVSQIAALSGSEAARGAAQNSGMGPTGQLIAQLAGAIPGAMGAGLLQAPQQMAKSAAMAPVEGVSNIAKGITATSAEDLPAVADQMKSSAGNLYTQMRQAGAVFNPDASKSLVSNIDNAVASKQFIPQLNPKTTAIIDHMRDAADNGSLGLDEIDQYRRLLGRVGNTEDGVSAGLARKAIDGFVNGASSDDLENGSLKAVDLLNQGRAAYSQASKFEDIADLISKANGDPNKIKQYLTSFAANEDNTKGWTMAEKAALNEAKNTGVGENVLKAFGKFGIDFSKSGTGNTVLPVLTALGKVGGASFVPGGIPAVIGGTLARQGQKYLARGKAQNLLDALQGSQ